MRHLNYLLLLISGLLVKNVISSEGDRQQNYKTCVNECSLIHKCSSRKFPPGQPLLLKLTGWTCEAECKYQCMWRMERSNRSLGQAPKQYYGKWPFLRLFGCQEFFSSIFSIGNLLAQTYGYRTIYCGSLQEKAGDWFLHMVVKLSYWASVNAWFWSTIFHARDVDLTMYLDYLSAIGLLLTSLIVCFVRAFNIRVRLRQQILICVLAAYFLRHSYLMVMVDFDFSWNMKVAVTIALTYSITYLLWIGFHYISGNPQNGSNYALMSLCLTLGSSALEIFDFPPIFGLIDAHALWHLFTIPAVIWLYMFYRENAIHDLGIQKTIVKKQALAA